MLSAAKREKRMGTPIVEIGTRLLIETIAESAPPSRGLFGSLNAQPIKVNAQDFSADKGKAERSSKPITLLADSATGRRRAMPRLPGAVAVVGRHLSILSGGIRRRASGPSRTLGANLSAHHGPDRPGRAAGFFTT